MLETRRQWTCCSRFIASYPSRFSSEPTGAEKNVHDVGLPVASVETAEIMINTKAMCSLQMPQWVNKWLMGQS
eukprot:scaffold147566_cov36-Prasinocladus_malaysianus.AAC.1